MHRPIPICGSSLKPLLLSTPKKGVERKEVFFFFSLFNQRHFKNICLSSVAAFNPDVCGLIQDGVKETSC